ncbi:uncharacterized protein EDB93DRAFT_1106765 [Suillus bovinus]|uniref:uncharacterized protein n=1 Tax=Suillus bovinus TaxID=48563 RepID=UPI001B862EB4|nr:uncharacterized protein EDB93DRAFT_1106765 [Suillus bovinus]KAG2136984.1 hypothetical protein EDB93DRAFT_1106765 [Suillus bovinus]
MHNLFLRVVQHHFRNLITIDRQASKAIRKPDIRPVNPKELDKGKKVMESNRTASAMTRLRLPVLQALVQEAGITLSSNGCDTKKKMIKALLAEPTYSISINNDDRMEVDNKAFVMEELYRATGLAAEALTDQEINAIQAELSGIMQPSWHCRPPKNLGDVEHVTLLKLWGTKYGDGEEWSQN